MNVKLSYSDFIQNPTVLQNAALIEKKKSEAKPQVVYPNIIVEKDKEYDAFELTDIQMAYLVGRNAALKSGGISTHMYTEVKTELDLSKFNIALNKAILRHGMLRAVILKTGKQKILKNVPEYNIHVEDISNLKESDQLEKIIEKRKNYRHMCLKQISGHYLILKHIIWEME